MIEFYDICIAVGLLTDLLLIAKGIYNAGLRRGRMEQALASVKNQSDQN